METVKPFERKGQTLVNQIGNTHLFKGLLNTSVVLDVNLNWRELAVSLWIYKSKAEWFELLGVRRGPRKKARRTWSEESFSDHEEGAEGRTDAGRRIWADHHSYFRHRKRMFLKR